VTAILKKPAPGFQRGETRTRFALADNEGHLHKLREFKTGEFLGFMDAAETYLVYSKREVDLPISVRFTVIVQWPLWVTSGSPAWA
jgi:hypothetical protein